MPVPIPPWIQGVSAGQIGQLYTSGLQLGARIAEAQQALTQRSEALKQEKEIAEMRLLAAQKQQEQENARQLQQMTMQKAYHDQTLDLERTKLAQENQKIQLAARQASQDFARQERVKSRLAAGEPAAKVLLEEGVRGAAGAALRAQEGMKQYGGIELKDIGGGYRLAYRPGSPGAHVIPPPKSHELTPSALASIAKAIPDLQFAAKTGGTNNLAQKILDKIVPMINEAGTSKSAGGQFRKVTRNPKTGKLEFVAEPAGAPAAVGMPDFGTEDEEEY